MKESYLLSIIVPVYNAESFISRCLDSILTQSFSDFELVLVDDGSTDRSGKICDIYSKSDSRVKVVHKRQAGASAARNTGIDNSSSELIGFIDSDDEICPYYLQSLVDDYYKGEDVDFVIQGMKQKWSDHDVTFKMSDGIYDLTTSDGARIFKNVKINDFSGPYCKLFKRTILEKDAIRFNTSVIYAEDFDFMLRYLMHCKMVVTSSATNYYYIMHQGSISSKIYEFDKELSGLRQLYSSFKEIVGRFNCDALIANRGESINAYIWRVIYSNYRNGYSGEQRKNNFRQIESEIMEFFASNFRASTCFTKLVKYLFCGRHFILLDQILNFRLCVLH